MTNMFSELTENPHFDITYIDNENDSISVGSDLELEEALRQLPMEDPKVLRLYIKAKRGYSLVEEEKNGMVFVIFLSTILEY